jgi:hypothetical protein
MINRDSHTYIKETICPFILSYNLGITRPSCLPGAIAGAYNPAPWISMRRDSLSEITRRVRRMQQGVFYLLLHDVRSQPWIRPNRSEPPAPTSNVGLHTTLQIHGGPRAAPLFLGPAPEPQITPSMRTRRSALFFSLLSLVLRRR